MVAMNLNDLSQSVHAANIKWWQDPATQQPIKRNKGELIALIHSEISECDDGEWGGWMDDKLPHRRMGEVECADAAIRLLDYANGFGHDLKPAGMIAGAYEFTDLNHLSDGVVTTFLECLKQRGVSAIHSEISKLLEHERKGTAFQASQSIVSCLIYISVYAKLRGYDLQGAFDDKTIYNAHRQDHTHKARLEEHGKQF